VTIGLGRLSRAARLSENNCRLNIRTLVKKLAIEEIGAENSREGIGKTYRIYSYSAILERRRAAGLEWVIRTKGVAFVDPRSGEVLRQESGPPTESIPHTVTIWGIDSGPGIESGPHSGTESAGGSPTDSIPPFRNSIRNVTEETSSSEDCTSLVEKLQNLGVVLDDDAARRIVRRCRNANSTATIDEIRHFAELKVAQLSKRRNIENWPGLLISAIPAYFDAPATELIRYRAGKAKEQHEHEEIARKVLGDPEATEDEKAWAHLVMEQSSND
jgi:hypothetical protein